MKEVTLLGMGPSRKECPYATEELWGTCDCLLKKDVKEHNFTKVFAFDSSEDWDSTLPRAFTEAHKRNIPIVSIHPYATEPFLVHEVAVKLHSNYFMPTMSYMIAYALFLDYDGISIYGIDQGPQWYYQFGKCHITFWIGLALGRGARVQMGRNSVRWAYTAGLDTFPRAFMEKESALVAKHVVIHPGKAPGEQVWEQ